MKKISKIAIFSIVSLTVFFAVSETMAATTTNTLRNRLLELLREVDLIRTEIRSITPGQDLCRPIITNLRVGSTGSDVSALHFTLERAGFPAVDEQAGEDPTIFTERTKQAVIKLQEKFSGEVLAPHGLSKGTGFVGSSTRAFLSKEYPCSTNDVETSSETDISTANVIDSILRPGETQRSPIAVISPNGGQDLAIGSSQKIVWTGGEPKDKTMIRLSFFYQPCTTNVCPLSASAFPIRPPIVIAEDLPNTGVYRWTIKDSADKKTKIEPGQYMVDICVTEKQPASSTSSPSVRCDSSDRPIVISSGTRNDDSSNVTFSVRTLNGKVACIVSPCEVPVSGASVYIHSDSGVLLSSGLTDEDGWIKFNEIPGGFGPKYQVTASAIDFNGSSRAITAQSDEQEVVLVLN
jgi:hypothetical protein